MTQVLPGRVVIIRKKPRRVPLAQTQIDHDLCIQRRRCNGALYERMTQILGAVFGGKLTKQNLMDLAEKIAAQKQIKIDRAAKRMKEGLICWFCENAYDLVAREEEPYREFDLMQSSLEAWEPPDVDEFEFSSLLKSDDLPWILDPEQTS
jgi:hypothetical protein